MKVGEFHLLKKIFSIKIFKLLVIVVTLPGQYVSNGATYIKTVYDPAIFPEPTMKALGYKSFKDAMDNNKFDIVDPLTGFAIPRSFQGSANGRIIMGHYKTINDENVISSWWIIK